ncbi:1,4-dihydroxy-2-naphthoate prenyltransferase [Homoserinimonas aerilata]|uniref:1,4-dihydroxy-2-naphthoate octaprenyltransferase n=1 Tax=Homoserinimonas aerilata TaxID=1162970 RepID=A0A542YA61_9MICO|nr:1,4-dihydroxy-2-naphthoate prenyltransferase [Homoserinimonas aerilata]
MARPKQQRIDPTKVARAARSQKKVIPPKAKVKKAGPADWIAGARIRTLPLAVAPVALGTAAAYVYSFEWHWVRALLCLALAVLLQIGVNYANDYSDGIRGTDAHRVGPSRLTGSGAAKPRTVLAVALTFFALGALAGLAVVVLSGQWWLLAVGAACIAAGWFYTGGRRPYGYYGLGELFVFVFFGLVATAGTMYVQVGDVSLEGWMAGVAAGLLACAVLVSNNMRDIEQDRVSGKRTLSVLIGITASRILFTVLLLAPFVILFFFGLVYLLAPYVFFVLLLAIPTAIIALTGKTAAEFLLVLKLTSLTALLFALGLGAALVF